MSFTVDVHHHILPDVFWRATASIWAMVPPPSTCRPSFRPQTMSALCHKRTICHER